MSQDTLNKFVAVFQAASFGLILWDNIKSLAVEIDLVARLNGEDELEAFIGALDDLDPNTPPVVGVANHQNLGQRTRLLIYNSCIYTEPWTRQPASTSLLCLLSFWTGFAHTHP